MKKYTRILLVVGLLHLVQLSAHIKVLIASESNQKVNAVKRAFQEKFPHEIIEYVIAKTSSGVPEQPVGRACATEGVRNRLQSLPSALLVDADYAIAIENYIEQVPTVAGFAWCDKGLIICKQKEQEIFITTKPVFFDKKYVELAQKMSVTISEKGYSTTVGKAIQASFAVGVIDAADWHRDPLFGGVSRQQLLKDALDKALYNEELVFVKSLIVQYPDFPKPGILFSDFLPIVQNPKGLQIIVDFFAQRYAHQNISAIVGLESRGFILAAALAYALGVSFVPVRKPGKLPGAIYSVTYQKEYGVDTLSIAQSALRAGERVIIIDDLIATGGSARAAIELVKKAGGEPVEFVSLLNIPIFEEQARLSIPSFNLID